MASIGQLLGSPAAFVSKVVAGLRAVGVDPGELPMSHLGYKATTAEEYRRVRDGLLTHAAAIAENIHNDRPIAKIVLRDPLEIDHWSLDLIEVMPPKSRRAARTGLEHVGFVVGPGLDDFAELHAEVVTERQDQGPWCQPACIGLLQDMRAKFYHLGLRAVVEAEGVEFTPVGQSTR